MRFDLERAAIAWRRACAGLAFLSLATCHHGGFELAGSEYHSAHFDYRFHPDDATVCPQVMDSLEQHRALLAAFLGIDEGRLAQVTYFKLRDSAEYANRTVAGESSGADSGEDFVVSSLPFDEHELVHTITLSAWGRDAPSFLVEGIAVALSCDPSAVEVTTAPYDGWFPFNDSILDESHPASVAFLAKNKATSIAGFYDIASSDAAGYAAAGAVVTYLLDNAEVERFHQLWLATSHSSSAADFSRALHSLYGQSLDDVWQTLKSTRHRPCAPVWMCSLPELTDHEQGTLNSSCTGKTLGRPTRGNLRLQYPAFSKGVYSMFGGTPARPFPVVTGISLISCGPDPAGYLPRDPEMHFRDTYQADTWIPSLSTPSIVTLETYAWVLQNLQQTYNTPDGQINYRTLPLAPSTARCSDATPNVIPSTTASALWLPNDSQKHYARFQLETENSGDQLYVDAYDFSPGLPPGPDIHVALCAGCDGDEAVNCNGCPAGTTDCIVRFQNDSVLPIWLRLVNGAGGYSPSRWADPDAGVPDAGSNDAN